MPNHTFVVPVYGESPYLEACLKSLLAQSVSGPVLMSSSTLSAHAAYLSKKYNIPFHLNPEGGTGIAGDWNFALSIANTPWVTLAHQDDIFQENYRSELLKNVSGENNLLIAFTDYADLIGGEVRRQSINLFVKRLLLLPFKFTKTIGNRQIKKMMLMAGCPVCCPSVAFYKPLLKNFRFNQHYQCALDWEAWLQLAGIGGGFLYISKTLVMHRIHSQSETSAKIMDCTRADEEQKILKQLWGRWLAKPLTWLYARAHHHNFS